jgi:hypothetical protein
MSGVNMNKRTTRGHAPMAGALLLATILVAGTACDTDDQPGLVVLTPSPGSTVSLGPDMKQRFTISANDFSLKRPEECGGSAACGPAYLNIDGDACNQPGKPYNAILADGRLGQDFFIEADFSLCPPASQLGSHNVTISLRDPMGRVVTGDGGQPVQATLSVTTTR